MILFREAFSQFLHHCRLAREAFIFWRETARHNASLATKRSRNKIEHTLLRDAHVIEKGLSLRNPRRGFGQPKVLALLVKLERYMAGCGENGTEFVHYPLSVVRSYIEHSRNTESANVDIEAQFRQLAGRLGKDINAARGGVQEVARDQILARCNSDFESLLRSRHSIRYFSRVRPPRETIEKALEMAQLTPSACNRQGWRTHVFFGESSQQMMTWHGGAAGFEDEVRCCILVAADLNAFLLHEIHQAYVDGGMYAMNLLNALHSSGLGTIPLSCGFYQAKLAAMKKMFCIPANEVPILIIGIGCLEERFRVAVSKRKPLEATNTNH